MDFSPAAAKVFNDWFDMFSILDPDTPAGQEPQRVMTPPSAAAFVRSCTDDNCNEQDARITNLFNTYDLNHDNKLERLEFLTFYMFCCQEKPEIVWQNLLAHGFRNDLKKPSEVTEDDENYSQPRKRVEDMPRYKISNNQEYFDAIFKLLGRKGEVSVDAWNLIRTLTTNPTLYKKVLYLDEDPAFKWEDVFDTSSIYKMLYTL